MVSLVFEVILKISYAQQYNFLSFGIIENWFILIWYNWRGLTRPMIIHEFKALRWHTFFYHYEPRFPYFIPYFIPFYSSFLFISHFPSSFTPYFTTLFLFDHPFILLFLFDHPFILLFLFDLYIYFRCLVFSWIWSAMTLYMNVSITAGRAILKN